MELCYGKVVIAKISIQNFNFDDVISKKILLKSLNIFSEFKMTFYFIKLSQISSSTIFSKYWLLRVLANWAVVVAQLVEWLLPIPEVRGSNPVIGKNLLISNICLLSTVYWKDENKEKEAGDGPFKKGACYFNHLDTLKNKGTPSRLCKD